MSTQQHEQPSGGISSNLSEQMSDIAPCKQTKQRHQHMKKSNQKTELQHMQKTDALHPDAYTE
ncbi:hypothetical protein D3C73_1521860 [compost metagenome]